MDPRKENVLRNQFAKEAAKHQIGSPFRINEYIEYRLKGLDKKTALEKTKSHP
jgi:hypothetical protein